MLRFRGNSMSFLAVNWLAVVLATVASFAFGAVWYMSLSKQWMVALGKTRDQLTPAIRRSSGRSSWNS